jgi:hypothetical protein
VSVWGIFKSREPCESMRENLRPIFSSPGKKAKKVKRKTIVGKNTICPKNILTNSKLFLLLLLTRVILFSIIKAYKRIKHEVFVLSSA